MLVGAPSSLSRRERGWTVSATALSTLVHQ